MPLQTDTGMWAYIGSAILDGALPYRDLWESKPPGIFYTFAAVEWLCGNRAGTALLWMDAVLSLAVFGVTYRLARRFANPTAAAAAVLLLSLVFCHRILADWGNNLEKFVALFEASACLIVLRGLDRDAGWRVWLSAGVLCGLAALFKQTGLLFLIVASLYVLRLAVWRPSQRKQAAGRVGLLAIGAALPWAVVVAWMAHAGILDAFWKQAVCYDLARVASTESEGPRLLAADHWRSVWDHLKLTGVLFGPALLALFWWAARRIAPTEAEAERVRLSIPKGLGLITLYWALTIAVFPVAPYGYGHYLLQAAPPAAILAAWLIDRVISERRRRGLLILVTATLLLGVLPLGDHFVFTFDGNSRYRQAYESQRVRMAELVGLLEQSTRPVQSVMLWPPDYAVSYDARRRTPLESSNSDVIFKGKIYRLDPTMEKLIQRLEENPPDVIVDWSRMRLQPPSPEWGGEPVLKTSPEGYSLLEPPNDDHPRPEGRVLAEFKRWVRANYGGQRWVRRSEGDWVLFFRGRPWRTWEDFFRIPSQSEMPR